MKTKLFFALSFLTIFIGYGQNNFVLDWQESFGGSDSDKGSKVINTSDNNLVWIGQYKSADGDFSNNYGNYDVWIKKTDRQGNQLWLTTFGGNDADYLTAVVEDANGDFLVVGNSKSNSDDITGNHGNYDVLASKISSSGSILWQKSLGGSDIDKATSVVATDDGGFLVLSHSKSIDGDITTNLGDYDIWLIKLDTSGNIIWQKNLGGSNAEYSYKIITTIDGNYVFSAYSKSNDGDLSVNNGNLDYWIVKIDPTGNIIWQKTYGGSSIDKEADVIETTYGGYVVAGYSSSSDGDVSNPLGSFDFWVVGLDAGGNLLWNKNYGGTGADFATTVSKNYSLNADTYTILGFSNSDDNDFSSNLGGYDAWIINIADNGDLLNKYHFGGSNADYFFSITNDQCFIAGTTKSTDGDVTGAHGDYDAWLIGMECGSSSIEYPTEVNIKIYPNPSSGILNVIAKNITQIQIIDITGKILATYKYDLRQDQSLLNLKSFSSGNYFIKVKTNQGIINKKLIMK